MIDLLRKFTLEQDIDIPSEENELLGFLLKHDYETLIANFQYFDTEKLKSSPTQEIASKLNDEKAKNNVLLFGLACLQTFVAENWTQSRETQITTLLPWLTEDSKEQLLDLMIKEGDGFIANSNLIELLALASFILVDNSAKFDENDIVKLWSVRCALIVQAELYEKSSMLFEKIKSIFNDLEGSSDVDLKYLILIEQAKFNYTYHFIRECGEATEASAAALGLQVQDTGALGKRTKFQIKDLAQFTIILEEQSHYVKRTEIIDASYLPKDLRLDDDLRLEKIQFQDEGRQRTRELDSLQQSCLLARYFLKERNLPVDDISWQELMPHLDVILAHPVSWAVHVTALFNRCKLESKSRRTVERARAQLETILEAYLPTNQIPRQILMKNIYTSRLPPRWRLQKELGSILMSLGATKGALDQYLKLECWDEVIVCYNMLQMRHKSAEVIKKRLEDKETSRLWCQLGDATDDIQHYHKALELSNNKSARALKSLGLHAYFNKNYTEAMEWFRKSLTCSRFQLDVLLRLGYAAMEIEAWADGAQAYRDYCSLESDNFEAWNNLAKCYIKTKQKERAWRVLQEAVRCDFDNWKVWDNLMVLSVDVGAFDEVIRSYNRILDIKQTHIDEAVLKILAGAVIDGLEDSVGESSLKYKPNLLKLLGRLTVGQPKEPVPWNCYGRILVVDTDSNSATENQVKGCQYLQKSLATYTARKGWDKELVQVTAVLETCRQLVHAILAVTSSSVQQLQLANSARLTLVSSLKLVERSQTSIATGDIIPEVKDLYNNTKTDVDALLNRIEELKAGN